MNASSDDNFLKISHMQYGIDASNDAHAALVHVEFAS